VQFLPDAHQGFRPDHRPIIQAHKEGFGLQIRSPAGEGSEGFLHTTKTTNFGTGNGFSKSRSTICPHAATGTADTPGGLGAILTQVDKDGNFHTISFASRQLKDHEINYSPFLLEAAAAVWGMDFFNEYLKGKRFILYTDHKPLEKLGHLHSKTMNQLQTALLEHDFVIQYKKGSNMPADYLSRLPGAKDNIPSISAFDPFQTDLYDLQMKDDILQGIQTFRNTGKWPQNILKQDQAYYTAMIVISRQKQTHLGPAKRLQLPQDSAVPPFQVQERSHVQGP